MDSNSFTKESFTKANGPWTGVWFVYHTSDCRQKRGKWIPIQSVIIESFTESNVPKAGVWFVYHTSDFRQNWITDSTVDKSLETKYYVR